MPASLSLTVRQWAKRFALSPALGNSLLILMFVGYGLIGMRNFDLRMANISDDDGPIFYSQAFKTPELFGGDYPNGFPLDLLTKTKVVTSAMIWIPALLWRYLNIDPYPTTWLLTLIQGLSLILSIYILTWVVTRTRLAAALAAIFASMAAPWMWALANYQNDASWNFFPYPANLAIAPILLAFACLVKKHARAALGLLLVGGIIHPTLALYACAIFGCYWLAECWLTRAWGGVWRLAVLVVVAIIITVPGMWISLTQSGTPLPTAEIIAGMRLNQHVWPWNYADLWTTSWTTLLKWLVLAGLSWRYRSSLLPEVWRLWLAACVGTSLVGLTQVAGAMLQNPFLLTLGGLRSFSWLALLSVPLVAYYWYMHLRSGHWPGVVVSLLCLALPFYISKNALFWPLILALALIDISQGSLSIWRPALPEWGKRCLWALAWGALLVWCVTFWRWPELQQSASGSIWKTALNLVWDNINPLPPGVERIKLGVAVVLLGVGLWLVLRRIPAESRSSNTILTSLAIGLAVGVYGANGLWLNWQAAKIESVTSDTYTLAVQLWARDHTPPSTLFVVPTPGWRTLSLRRKLSPFTRENYAYVAPREAKEYRDRLLAFYGISAEEGQEFRGYGPNGIYIKEVDLFRQFQECDFLRFASEFGASYLVLPTVYTVTEKTKFQFRDVYENPYYVVYRLDQSLLGGTPPCP